MTISGNLRGGTYTQHKYPDDIPHQQHKCVLSASAKVFPMDSTHDVGILIDKLQELLETPEETFKEAHNAFGQFVIINDPDFVL
ncbi:hypothetical protein NQ317_002466 [Molorchus minor]|uniref:Uncharacterized protein n=1 Tax=Molorchus minor TaxID=1323400 RepID=A0ABQ9JJ60_9CUCU|nr:hypothetical protein NQ317_002466 [Molorchus minor]